MGDNSNREKIFENDEYSTGGFCKIVGDYQEGGFFMVDFKCIPFESFLVCALGNISKLSRGGLHANARSIHLFGLRESIFLLC